jgi:succinoglycan biosynthesis transport protein ExoP
MSFGRFLLLLRARLGLIAGITLAAIFLAGLVTLMLPKRYYAEATAVLEQPLGDATGLAAGAAGISYFLATQRDVVASRNVAARVIETLGLERDPDKAQRMLGGWNPISAIRNFIVGLFVSGDGGRDMTLREWLTERLLAKLSVTSGRDSRLIKIGFSSQDPEFAAAVANAFMKAFLDANVNLKAAPARTETAWLEGQMKMLREQLGQAEGRLSQFQQEKGIVATDEKLDFESQRLTELSTQLANAQSEAFAASARRQQLQQFAAGRGKMSAGDVPSDVITHPVVMSLRQEVAQREAKLQDMARQIGPNHPRYQAATGELAQLRGQMSAEMRSIAAGLASAGNVSGQRETALRQAVEQQKQRMLGMKKDRDMISSLLRDVDNAQKAYTAAVQRISQARIESANERPNASVVDEAGVPPRPAGPRMVVNLAIGAILGAAFGLGLALLLEASQRLVRTGEDLTEILGVPILAVLPPRAVRTPMARALGAAKVVALPRP